MDRVIATPIGEMFVAATDKAIVAVRFDTSSDAPRPTRASAAARVLLDQLQRELDEYFGGARRAFSVSIDPKGTPFQQEVWRRVSAIPFGETASYSALARDLGSPRASRAVGAANGKNPLSLLVPCHRVLGKTGDLVGYAWGLRKKQWLLEHEGYSSSPPVIANSRLLSTISRSSLPTLKNGNRFAATGTGSPVRGLRPL